MAQRLGVRASALYYHVKSKQDLLDEMGTEIHRRVVTRLRTRAENTGQPQNPGAPERPGQPENAGHPEVTKRPKNTAHPKNAGQPQNAGEPQNAEGPRSASRLDDLAAYARALRAEYLEHRDGARAFVGTLITDPDVLRAQEPWLRRWLAEGVPKELAFDGFELVTAFVVGFVIEERSAASTRPVAKPRSGTGDSATTSPWSNRPATRDTTTTHGSTGSSR